MLPLLKLVSHERLIEPQCANIIGTLLHQHADGPLGEAPAASIDFNDFAADCLYFVFIEIADLTAIAEILIVSREEKNEVTRGANIQLRQRTCPLRSNTAYEFDRGRQKLGSCRLAMCCCFLLSR